MFKGHAKIELTDINTGKVKTIEHDNMFTKSIENKLNNIWLQMIGGVATINSWELPLYQKSLIGGIALFSETIEEDETQVWFPKNNKVVGYAGTIASDGTSQFCGSRNLSESIPYDAGNRSATFVWDFSTSEGNGEISAIGLMDGRQADYYGDSFHNKEYSKSINVNSFFGEFGRRIVNFNSNNEIIWMVNGTGKVTVNKSRYNFNDVKIDNSIFATEIIETHDITLPGNNINYLCTYWKDGDDGYWYGFCTFNSSAFTSPTSTSYNEGSSSQYLRIIRINKTNYGMDYHDVTLPEGYVHYMAYNPIITENFIAFPYSSNNLASSYTSSGRSVMISQNVKKDKIMKVNKLDWTISIHILKNKSGEEVHMFPDAYTENIGNYFNAFFGIFFLNFKLPNGTYQFHDLILDDDLNVLHRVDAPYSATLNRPLKSLEETFENLYYFEQTIPGGARPNTYNQSWEWCKTYFIIPNYDLGVLLISSAYGAAAPTVYMKPLAGQQLITINNLDTPVEKTASQTMKITYTITDAEEV